jgi:glycerate kinase
MKGMAAPMRVVVAPDKFKGSLDAASAASAMARGVHAADPSAVVDRAPVADGGEGTVSALVASTGGQFVSASVTGPLGHPVEAVYGMLGGGHGGQSSTTAVIEMAAASGLALISPQDRDPGRTSTRGTGEMVLAARRRGADRIILGIGGSATNDGGAGLAQALGFRLLDADGRDLGPGGLELARLDRIDASGRPPELDGLTIRVACDVDNPLCGPRGASAVYGPQKGASPELVRALDAALARLAEVLKRDLHVDVADVPGAGAAGGLGAGLMGFLGATLASGVDLVLDAVGLDQRLDTADLCLTGEGAIDASSAFGKTIAGVARRARARGVPVLAIGGSLGPGARDVMKHGVDAIFSICPAPATFEEAVAQVDPWLASAAENAVRAFLAGSRTREKRP